MKKYYNYSLFENIVLNYKNTHFTIFMRPLIMNTKSIIRLVSYYLLLLIQYLLVLERLFVNVEHCSKPAITLYYITIIDLIGIFKNRDIIRWDN